MFAPRASDLHAAAHSENYENPITKPSASPRTHMRFGANYRCRRSSGVNEAGKLKMSIDYLLGAVVTILVTVYLIYALLRPERF
jgi:K+-transporting ATPase KdpF subunit